MSLSFYSNVYYSWGVEYYYIFFSFCINILISILLYAIVTLLTYKEYDIEKISGYECGFHPFEDTRQKFNVRFYLVSILFIIFDLEITFLIPWAVYLQYLNFFGIIVMLIFLFILTLGFIYEWINGALEWE